MQSARPLPPRSVEVAVEAARVATVAENGSSEQTAPLAVSVRIGLDPRTELGLHTGFATPRSR